VHHTLPELWSGEPDLSDILAPFWRVGPGRRSRDGDWRCVKYLFVLGFVGQAIVSD